MLVPQNESEHSLSLSVSFEFTLLGVLASVVTIPFSVVLGRTVCKWVVCFDFATETLGEHNLYE